MSEKRFFQCFTFVSILVVALFSSFNLCYSQGTEIDIENMEIDCGDHAYYHEEYKVCFCEDGYHAGADGQTCVREKSEEPEEKPEIKKAPVKEVETAPAAEKAPEKAEPPTFSRGPDGKIFEALNGEVEAVVLYRGARVKIELLEMLSSQLVSTGDEVSFKAVEALKIDGVTVIENGAEVLGRISYVRPAKGWGKSAQLDIELVHAKAVDGTKIPLAAVFKDEKSWAPSAAGKTLASTLAAGPILGFAPLGLAVGGGMKGKKVFVEKGTQIDVYVAEDTRVGIEEGVVVEESPAAVEAVEKKVIKKVPVDVKTGKKVCFNVCKETVTEEFKKCMAGCEGCLDVCDGLDGADFEGCLSRCAGAEKTEI